MTQIASNSRQNHTTDITKKIQFPTVETQQKRVNNVPKLTLNNTHHFHQPKQPVHHTKPQWFVTPLPAQLTLRSTHFNVRGKRKWHTGNRKRCTDEASYFGQFKVRGSWSVRARSVMAGRPPVWLDTAPIINTFNYCEASCNGWLIHQGVQWSSTLESCVESCTVRLVLMYSGSLLRSICHG